jgi:uncharacterized repeat protein (TIGR01451 family)
VSAPQASALGGKVYVFGRSGPTWTEQTWIPGPAPDTTVADHFGAAVSASGDTVVVGAPDDDLPTATTGGSVYVFTRSGPDWIRQKLVASNAGRNDHFGTSVSVSGDTLVVGAPDIDAPAGTHGSSYAYAFVRDGTYWREQQLLGSSWSERFDSVSVSGDTAVVGGRGRAPYYDTGGATVYVRSGTTWAEQEHLVSPLGAPYDDFGSSVSLDGDTLAVADPRNSGTYVFVRSAGVWTLRQTLGVSGPVSISGDTLVVGRWVFVRAGADWHPQQALTASDGTTSFSSAQVSGTRLVLGRPSAAYVFERPASVWVERQKLVSPQPYDRFGDSVSLSGGMVVVGDPYRDTPAGPDAGAAFVYGDSVADLWVRKTDGRAAVVGGDTVTYTITVGNAGPSAVHGAVVSDVLPASLSCTTTCAGAGSATCPAGPLAGNVADAVDIPANASVTYTAVCVVAASATGSLSNTATVAPPATMTDPYPGNNSATDTDTLDPVADLEVVLTQSGDNASAGEAFEYSAVVTNRGPWPSTGVKLTNVLPSGTTLIASTPGPGVCGLNSMRLECDLGPLAAGETHVVTVDVAVDAAARGVLTDTAVVTGNEPDPVATNDRDTKKALASGPSQFFTIAPCRLVDTRLDSPACLGGPALNSRTTRAFPLVGRCGIPPTARAVALNVTVTGATADGNLRVFPAGLEVPLTATVSYRRSQTRASNAIVALNGEGEIAAYADQAARTRAHVIVDVTGYFE